MPLSRLFAFAGLTLSVAVAAAADPPNWPRWRGPAGDG